MTWIQPGTLAPSHCDIDMGYYPIHLDQGQFTTCGLNELQTKANTEVGDVALATYHVVILLQLM